MTSKNSKTNDLDTDINNYSIEDLLLIFGLNEPTQNELNIVANKMINKMVSDGNDEIAEFLQNAKEKLFEELYEDEVEYDDHIEQAKQATDTLIDWWKNQYPRKKTRITTS
jgi:guanylate kinase